LWLASHHDSSFALLLLSQHYDGCDITWQCMLSASNEYEGGGTYIRSIKKTVMLNQGQILVHPGELYHKGCDITRGSRYLIVCFTDGHDPKVDDNSSSKDPLHEHHRVSSSVGMQDIGELDDEE
jgi:predicted 2-oxoglutarate/Fe(II)-dependent dioxygenase YbiX